MGTKALHATLVTCTLEPVIVPQDASRIALVAIADQLASSVSLGNRFIGILQALQDNRRRPLIDPLLLLSVFNKIAGDREDGGDNADDGGDGHLATTATWAVVATFDGRESASFASLAGRTTVVPAVATEATLWERVVR